MTAIKQKFLTALCAVKAFLSGSRGNFVFYLVVIILVNIAASFLYFKLDLTRDNSYSLSDESKRIVEKIEEPMIVKLFFSDNLAAPYNGVKKYVEDIIEQYSDESGDNFKYEFLDMSDDKNKKLAESYGIYPVQVTQRGADEVRKNNVFMGLAIIHGDLVERINEITDYNGVEYRISCAIRNVKNKVNALSGITTPLKVTVYLSSSLAQYGISGYDDMAALTRESFNNVNRSNYNKLQYEFVKIDDEKKAEEISVRYGIPLKKWAATRLPDGRAVTAGSGVAGIVVELDGKFRTIQLPIGNMLMGGLSFVGLSKLDRTISDAVDFILAKTTSVGYVTGHGEANLSDGRQGAAVFKQIASDFYQISELDLNSPVPANIKSVVINGPKSPFSDGELYNLDQFVMRGGSVVLFYDSFAEQQGQPLFQVNTGLDRILSSYGIKVNGDFILDKNCYVERRQGSDENLYFIPIIDRAGMNSSLAATRYIKKMMVAKVSSVEADKTKSGIQFTEILKSSPESWVMKNVNNQAEMYAPPKDLSTYNIAIAADGIFDSAFSAGAPAVVSAKNDKSDILTADNILKKSVVPAKIFVMGSSVVTSPMLLDAKMHSPTAIFVHNILDYVNGVSGFEEMRSKGMEYNPVKELSAGARLASKIFNIVGIPLLIIACGLVVYRIKQNRRKIIKDKFTRDK